MAHPVKDKLKIKKLYNASSHTYIQLYLEEQLRKYNAIPMDINEGVRLILDVGCGPGLLNKVLPLNIYYVGIDLSNKQLINAKNIINRENSDLICGDIDQPPFRPSSFENIYSITQVHHAINIYRQLKIFTELSRRHVVLGLLKKVFNDPTNIVPSNVIQVYDGGADWVIVMTRDKLLKYLKEKGYVE